MRAGVEDQRLGFICLTWPCRQLSHKTAYEQGRSEKRRGGFVEVGGDATVLLQLVEGALDHVLRSIECYVCDVRHCAMVLNGVTGVIRRFPGDQQARGRENTRLPGGARCDLGERRCSLCDAVSPTS